MTRKSKRWGLVGLVLGMTLPPATQTAGAQTATSVSIDSAIVDGSSITVSGAMAYGDDAAAPIQVAEDPMGDDADGGRVPQGTDLGNATIATDLAGKKLTFAFGVYDQTPGAKMAPTFVYVWPLMVNGNDEARFLSSGVAGSWSGAGPIVDPNGWFAHCTNTNGYICATPLTGTMGNGKVEIIVPFSQASAKPGYLIEAGGTVCSGSICSTFNPTALLFNNGTGGDTTSPVGYQMPGEVKLGVAPAATPDESVATPVTASISLPSGKVAGTFSGSVPKPATPGEYKVVAKTCFGNVESPVCSLTSTPLTAV